MLCNGFGVFINRRKPTSFQHCVLGMFDAADILGRNIDSRFVPGNCFPYRSGVPFNNGQLRKLQPDGLWSTIIQIKLPIWKKFRVYYKFNTPRMGRILNFWWHFKWINHDDPELGNFVQLSTVLRIFKQVLGTNLGLIGQENDTVENWEKSIRVLKPDLHLFSDLLAFGDHFVQLGHLFAGLHHYKSDADSCKHFVLVQKRPVVRVLWQ